MPLDWDEARASCQTEIGTRHAPARLSAHTPHTIAIINSSSIETAAAAPLQG